MKTETLTEKLKSIDCKRDDKARRVSNVAHDTVADITADELETGVTLERLDTLNVPVLTYSTQVTIHGKLPAFNPAARPGGYKVIFQNGNGSIGVKFAAIDAGKKELIQRAAKVSQSGWHAYRNSTGFSLQRSFYVRNEGERAAQKAATIAALQSFPVSLLYGNAGAFALVYGIGYAVDVTIGAIPAANLWQLIREVLAVDSLADLEAREAAKQAERDAETARWNAEVDARNEKRAAESTAKVAAMFPLVTVPENGRVFVLASNGELLTVEMRKSKGRASYCATHRDGLATYNKTKVCTVFPWPKTLAAGRVYSETNPATVANLAATQATAGSAASDKADGPASTRQTFALFAATGKDFRKAVSDKALTYGQVSAAIAAAQPYRGDKPAALAAVSALIGSPS